MYVLASWITHATDTYYLFPNTRELLKQRGEYDGNPSYVGSGQWYRHLVVTPGLTEERTHEALR